MANLYYYIQWRGDLDFDRSPFNPVDNLIFSQLAYLPMDGIVPGPKEKGGISIQDLAEQYLKNREESPVRPLDDIIINEAVNAINTVKAVPRYMGCRLFGYVNHTDRFQEKQFSAFCTVIGKKSAAKLLVVYRGTDMSLTGWKEDFNMVFRNSIPSQREAVSYLEEMARQFRCPLMLAGHSKGGNLAIYAAAFCSKNTRKRITAIYSNDSPGFRQDVMQSRGYREIVDRIYAFIPQSSLVGMLFEHGETPVVIKSAATGLLQHLPSTWEVTYNDFIRVEELSRQSRLVDNIIRRWISKIDEGQRQLFIETVYRILVPLDAESVGDLTVDWQNTAVNIISTVKNMDNQTKKLMRKIIGELFKSAGKEIRKRLKKPISAQNRDLAFTQLKLTEKMEG
jgi:hypothetical protein